jgi:tRNA G46 methylase TrmB
MRWFSWFRQRPARQNASVTRARQQRDYVLGAGEAEISRLDLQHFIFRWELGDDFLAPVTNPRAILDVACGTGRWAREVARRFPQANIIGFDINYEQIERSLAEGAARGSDLMPKTARLLQGMPCSVLRLLRAPLIWSWPAPRQPLCPPAVIPS